MKINNKIRSIITFAICYIILVAIFIAQGVLSTLDSMLYGILPALIATCMIEAMGNLSGIYAEGYKQLKGVKKAKKTGTKYHRSLIRRIFAKLRLWNIHREWRKSDNGRSIPKMQRQFKKWAKLNPDMAETIQVVISQMHQLAVDHDIFEEVVEESEFGYKGLDSRKVFDHTAKQIRQNFSDIYNLMLLAGANEGQATLKTVDLNALAWELNGNRTKLALLSELNTQIVRLVNQIDSIHDNVMTEAEIEALAILNAMRFSKAAGFAAETISETKPESEPPAGTTASTP